MSSADQPAGYNSQLTDLGRQFDELAHQVDVLIRRRPTSGEDAAWMDLDVQDSLLSRHMIQQLIAKYRELVKLAGELTLALHRGGLIQVDGLPELVAAHDLEEWGGLVVDPANLFALIVGGPRIELRDNTGMGEFEKPNQGWPIPYSPAKPRSAFAKAHEELGEFAAIYPPDRDQCRRYAEFCRSLVGPGLEVKPASPDLTEFLLSDDSCEPPPTVTGRGATRVTPLGAPVATHSQPPGNPTEPADGTADRPAQCEHEAVEDVLPDFLPANYFRKSGDDWNIRYDNGSLFSIPGLVGVGHIHQLIQRPRHTYSGVDLRGIQQQHEIDTSTSVYTGAKQNAKSGTSHSTHAGAVIDHQTLNEAWKRVQHIKAELLKAREDCDESAVVRLEKEQLEIQDYLKKATIPGGAVRLAKADEARARKAVRKAIDEAIRRISQKDPNCATHFRNSLQGSDFQYHPERDVDWKF